MSDNERRIYVTRNSEYHVEDGICIGVRDRRTRAWQRRHAALSRRLAGGIQMLPNGCALPSLRPPQIGQAMCFDGDPPNEDEFDEDSWHIVTSRLEAVTAALEDERPSRRAG
jgi:hypothetical protein